LAAGLITKTIVNDYEKTFVTEYLQQLTQMNNDKNLISTLYLRRVVGWFLFPVILLPCGMFFLFVFLCFFWVSHDIFTVTILGWIILSMGLVWFISITAIILCLAIAFLQETKTEDDELSETGQPF
jgi:hypothetical protein